MPQTLSNRCRPLVRTPGMPRPLALAWAAGLVLCVSLSGCDRADPAARPLARASAELQGLSGGAFAAPTEAAQREGYRHAITSAKEVVDGEMGTAQQAAASGIMAGAHLGQSQSQIEEAALAEHEALNRASVIATLLRNRSSFLATASTAGTLDTGPMLAEIERSKKSTQDDLVGLRSRKSEVDARVQSLRTSASQKNTEADARFAEFAKVRESLGAISAREAEQRLIEAREGKRRGDAIRADAARLTAQADVLQPESRELSILIGAAESRLASLDRMALEIKEKAQAGRAAAAQAQALADSTSKEIETLLNELGSFRTQSVVVKQDTVIASLRTAATSARAATSEAGATGRLVSGRIQVALANALTSKASSAGMYANLLEQAINLTPPLAGKAALEAALNDARNLHKSTLDEAKAALEAAESAFAGVNLRGTGASEIKQSLTALSERLGAMTGRAPVEQPPATDAAPAEAPAPDAGMPQPAPAESTEPSAAASTDAAASEAWSTIFAALESGDEAALFAQLKTPTPEQEQQWRTMLSLRRSSNALDAACQEKFGRSFSDFQAAAQGISIPKATDFTLTADGDKVTATHPSQPDGYTLVRDGERWLLETPSLAGPAAMMVNMAPALVKAMDEVSGEVRGGTIASIEGVLQAVQQKVMSAMGSPPGGN